MCPMRITRFSRMGKSEGPKRNEAAMRETDRLKGCLQRIEYNLEEPVQLEPFRLYSV